MSPILTFNSVEAIKQCIGQGVGVAPIPEMALKNEIVAGELIRLTGAGKELETAILGQLKPTPRLAYAKMKI